MDEDVEIPAMDIVLADQFGGIGLVDGALQRLALADEFAAHVNVSRMRAHREAGDQAAFHQSVRIVPQDVAIFAGAGFGLVGIDDQVMRPLFDFLRHEGPFQAGRKTRAAAAAQAGLLHFVDNGFRAEIENDFGIVPLAALLGAFETGIAETVEIGEDAVFVREHVAHSPHPERVLRCCSGPLRPPRKGEVKQICTDNHPPPTRGGSTCERKRVRRGGGQSSRLHLFQRRRAAFGLGGMSAILRAGFGRLAGAQVLQNFFGRGPIEIFVSVSVDQDHRGVNAGAQAFHFHPGELAVGGNGVLLFVDVLLARFDDVVRTAQPARRGRCRPAPDVCPPVPD